MVVFNFSVITSKEKIETVDDLCTGIVVLTI